MRILFTGSRRMRSDEPIRRALRALPKERLEKPMVWVHGDGPGIPGCDALVDRLAKEWPNVTVEKHDPSNFGPWPVCGPRRNRHMVSLGADVCLAFPDGASKGTVQCMTEAWRKGIPTRVYLVKA